MTSINKRHIYRVQFYNGGQIYEVYVRNISNADVYGFIELNSFLFAKPSQVVIDPSEEKLRNEFGEVESAWVPIHAVIRIDRVRKEGTAKIVAAEGGNVTPFPIPMPKKT